MNRTRPALARLLAVSLAAVVLLVSPGRAAAASNGKIAFTSWNDGYARIYVMNADGSGVTPLTDNVSGDYFPAWSPDGTKIAFASGRDGGQDLWVMNADGTDQHRLYDSPCDRVNSSPSWSPDGAQIIFEDHHDCLDTWAGVFTIVNADGSGATHLRVSSPRVFDAP